MQRNYQIKGSEFLARTRTHGVILGDDMGLGKTNQVLCAIPMMDPEPETVLIIAPPSAHGTWQDEAQQWLGEETLILNAKKSYATTRIVIASPDEAAHLAHLPVTWDLTVIDEIHKYRNRSSKQYKQVKLVTRGKSKRTIGLTGSPIVNGIPDLWAQLSLVAPQNFTSYWSFVRKHCVTYVSSEGHMTTTGGALNPDHFKLYLRPYMLRRRKQTVAEELPDKIRQPLYVQMGQEQRRMYSELTQDMLTQTNNGTLVLADAVIAQISRLRQTLVTPSLYGSDAPSAAINTVVDSMQYDFDAKQNVIIFTPYAKAIPVISSTIRRSLHRYCPSEYIIQGSMSGEARAEVIRQFQTDHDPHKVMICTIGVATSFTATAASVGYFIGYDWTPANNIQAEDRMHRIGQTQPVHIRYVIHRNTVDEHIMNILDNKTTWAELASKPLRFMGGNNTNAVQQGVSSREVQPVP